MNNYFVHQRLERVTPSALFHLVNSGRVYISLAPLSEHEKGCVYKDKNPFNRWIVSWLISIKLNQSHRERIATLLHELFHIILCKQGIDDFSRKQEFSDKILEQAAYRFMRKYPHSVNCLWRQMRK